MKISNFMIAFALMLACVSVSWSVVSYSRVLKIEEKVDTFDVEIKGLTNMQKSQMEFLHLQTTINQLSFCLQAEELNSKELSDFVEDINRENNRLRIQLNNANMLINQLLDNTTKKENST